MHANGIDYDEENELIYLSVNFYNEVWLLTIQQPLKRPQIRVEEIMVLVEI